MIQVNGINVNRGKKKPKSEDQKDKFDKEWEDISALWVLGSFGDPRRLALNSLTCMSWQIRVSYIHHIVVLSWQLKLWIKMEHSISSLHSYWDYSVPRGAPAVSLAWGNPSLPWESDGPEIVTIVSTQNLSTLWHLKLFMPVSACRIWVHFWHITHTRSLLCQSHNPAGSWVYGNLKLIIFAVLNSSPLWC